MLAARAAHVAYDTRTAACIAVTGREVYRLLDAQTGCACRLCLLPLQTKGLVMCCCWLLEEQSWALMLRNAILLLLLLL